MEFLAIRVIVVILEIQESRAIAATLDCLGIVVLLAIQESQDIPALELLVTQEFQAIQAIQEFPVIAVSSVIQATQENQAIQE